MAKEFKAFGIDVSHWQGNVNFAKVKAAGKEFVILKAGGSDAGYYTDKKLDTYYKEATAAGLHVGAYYFAGFKFYGASEGKKCAEHFIKILGDKKFDYPVFLDIEAQPTNRKAKTTEAVIEFCKTMEAAGWWAGIYAADIAGWRDRLDMSKLSKYSHWVADYTDPVKYCTDYQMRQYSSKGKISGISCYVDLDYSLLDYPATIKKRKLNNYK